MGIVELRVFHKLDKIENRNYFPIFQSTDLPFVIYYVFAAIIIRDLVEM